MTKPECSFEGCPRATEGSGELCHGHYEQVRRGEPLRRFEKDESLADRFWRLAATVVHEPPNLDDPLVHPSVREGGQPCWTWMETRTAVGPYGTRTAVGPYGRFNFQGKSVKAHRASLLVHGVDLSPDQPVDHLCRNTLCVNPLHLEPVTWRENAIRGAGEPARRARMTHCKRGHDLNDPDNLYPSGTRGRSCRTCSRVDNVERAKAANTHCKRGHKRTERNTELSAAGKRMCLDCRTKDRVCAEGHAVEGDNLVMNGPYAECRVCRVAKNHAAYVARRDR